jgi:acetoin:2,6-dichlorophenolindophenol oxidoreductase subunit alpha
MTDHEVTDRDLASLLLIRHFERALLELFAKGEVHGTTHTCLGQEYIPVALNPLLEPDDFVFSNHRGHGHYLARFDDPEGLLAEIMGREGAVCGGVGGSQHIHRRGYLSTGVQGQNVAVGAGVALHFRKRAGRRLAMVYIGDGTWGAGVVYEALNMAQLWRLPLLVVVENNDIAQSTPRRDAMAGTVRGRAEAFGISYRHVTGADLAAIRRELAPVVAGIRDTPAPAVVEFDTVRLAAHSKGDDTRDREHVAELHARDWYARYRERYGERFATLDLGQRRRMDQVVADVGHRPLVGR